MKLGVRQSPVQAILVKIITCLRQHGGTSRTPCHRDRPPAPPQQGEGAHRGVKFSDRLSVGFLEGCFGLWERCLVV